MQIMVIVTGDYGRRHGDNIQENGPKEWDITLWEAPTALPLIIDYPEDYLPESMPPADLLLSFAEHKGVAELLPDIALKTGARAVVASIDNEAWLPRGLARQLRGWLNNMDVACATPKPLCSLTEIDYTVAFRKRLKYDNTLISEFAKLFGQPAIKVTVDPQSGLIVKTEVERDAVCGCARFVADGLVGISSDEAEEKAGLLHHHYPCLASMVKDPDYNMDTLMHASGNVLKENIGEQVRPFKSIKYITPGKKSE